MALTLRELDRQLANSLIQEIRALRSDIQFHLDQLQHKVHQIMATQAQVTEKLTALLAGVADQKTEIGAMGTFVRNLGAQIKALQDAAANLDLPQAFVDQLDAVGAAVTDNTKTIHDTIVDNTPSQGTPEPPVTPAPAPATP